MNAEEAIAEVLAMLDERLSAEDLQELLDNIECLLLSLPEHESEA